MSFECYDIEMRTHDERALVVLFSHSTRHHYRSVNFSADVLSIADMADSYFTTAPDKLADYIKEVSAPYEIIVLIGGSKGGHGALYYGILVGRMIDKPLRVLAFSPVVIVSENTNQLPYVSYRNLVERAQTSSDLAENLRRATDVMTAEPPSNLETYCIVGANNACDRTEVSRLGRAHILMLPMQHHETIIPFLCNSSDPRAVSKTVLLLYDRAAEEADISYLLEKGSIDKMIADLSRVPKQPRLNALVDIIIDGDVQKLRQVVESA